MTNTLLVRLLNDVSKKKSHLKTLQNSCKLPSNAIEKKTIRKIRNKLLASTVYISNVACEAIRARIA